jgi:hypothetical protein
LILVQWEIARAHALEGRWDLHDEIVATLPPRPIAQGRMVAR